jgi:hypothetical protein
MLNFGRIFTLFTFFADLSTSQNCGFWGAGRPLRERQRFSRMGPVAVIE